MKNKTYTTSERNKQIAIMMELNMDKKAVVFKSQAYSYDQLKFDLSYDWLMEAFEYVCENIRSSRHSSKAKVGEYFSDEFELSRSRIFIKLFQWTGTDWRMFGIPKNSNSDLCILYDIGIDCKTYKEGLFLAISDIAILINKSLNN